MLSYILAIICVPLIIIIDQLTKLYIASNFSLWQSSDFLSPIIRICYIHNTGGAWGMLSGKTWILIAVTSVIMAFCVAVMVKNWKKNPLLFWALTLVVSGGIGNLIDRIFRNGAVIDFLQFDFFRSFPIFNIADCSIVIGAGLLILYYIIDTVKEQSLKKQNGKD